MFGKAGNLSVVQFHGDFVQDEVNGWLKRNKELVVLDIKYGFTGALIIYRRGRVREDKD